MPNVFRYISNKGNISLFMIKSNFNIWHWFFVDFDNLSKSKHKKNNANKIWIEKWRGLCGTFVYGVNIIF